VRRTRRAIQDALVELILEHGYEGTTVQEIAERADVGRSTFYAHFVDKEALLMSAFEELHPAIDGGERRQSLFMIAGVLLEHADRERRLYRAVFGHQAASPLAARMEAELTVWVRGELGQCAPRASDRDVAMAARVSVSAFLGLIRWWMDADERVPPDEVAAGFTRLVLPGVAATLGIAPETLTSA
jgi:AcrR family transcriptional regulator